MPFLCVSESLWLKSILPDKITLCKVKKLLLILDKFIVSLRYTIMLKIKKNLFPDEINKTAEIMKALSHPARLQILLTLAARQSCVCGEIVEVLPLAQSTVSQHLKELQKVGMIQGTIDGLRSCYCLNKENFKVIKSSIHSILDSIEKGG